MSILFFTSPILWVTERNNNKNATPLYQLVIFSKRFENKKATIIINNLLSQKVIIIIIIIITMKKISQETYDETLLENEEVFELSLEEAIKETISQFEQQGIINLSSYIITTHPSSEKGKQERSIRSTFTSLLNQLDTFISSDGTLVLKGDDNCDNITTNDCTNGDIIFETIENIHGYYKHNGRGYDDGEKNDPIPFLTLTQSSSSIYTFMNLLSVISLPTENNNDNNKIDILPTKQQMNILNATLKLLITILCPTNKMEMEIKMPFKDSFVCMQRMVGLVLYFMTLLKQQNKSDDGNETTLYITTITLLMSCIMNACKNCEKNKVSFVRCLKQARGTNSIDILIDTFNKLELLNYTGTMDEKEQPLDIMLSGGVNCDGMKKKESTIGILSTLIILALELHHRSSLSLSTKSTASVSLSPYYNLMTECCKLISVLCRYDDFRTAESSQHASMVDSSYGGVSSAHDHVLEFNREGIIPTLHKVILLSLFTANNNVEEHTEEEQQQQHRVCWDNSKVGLAAAAMSATRVLAVNDEIVQILVAVGILKSVKAALDMGLVDDGEVDMSSITTVLDTEEEALVCDDGDNDNNDDENVDQGNSGNDKEKNMLFFQRQQLVSGAIGVIRNLCGNDEIKSNICLGSSINANSSVPSSLPSIMQAMNIFKKCSSIQEHGCGALAAMALRKPQNALRIVDENGASSILTAMKMFPNNVLVQRQGALAIRNIVSRLVANTSAIDAELGSSNDNVLSSDRSTPKTIAVRDIFLDLGAEIVLRGITGRHQGSIDESYAALRDLGCQVSMVKFDAKTQKATSQTVMFGDIKPQFRPVYEES